MNNQKSDNLKLEAMNTLELAEKKTELNGQTKKSVPYTTLQEYKNLVNHNPKKEWIKTNPYSQNAKYLPIRIVEQLLYKVFPYWQAEQKGQTK